MGQLALHVRFSNESQKPLWARSMRPLRLPHLCLLAQTLVVFFLCLGRPVLGYATLIRFGAHGARPQIIPRLQSEGPSGTRFPLAFMSSLSSAITPNCRQNETHNLGYQSRSMGGFSTLRLNLVQQSSLKYVPITRKYVRLRTVQRTQDLIKP